MKDSDMIIIEINQEDNSFSLKDCYSNTYTTPPSDTDLGGSDDLQILGSTGSLTEERIIKFKRKINTLDVFDRDLSPDQQLDIIVAKTENPRIESHGDRYWYYLVDYRENSRGEAFEKSRDLKKIVEAHSIINLIGWGFLADIGILSTRNLRHNNIYISLHSFCFHITDFGSITIGIIMLVKRNFIFI